MDPAALARRVGLMAAHGALMILMVQVSFDLAAANNDALPPEARELAWVTVGQFAGAAAAYLSLLLKRSRDALICEAIAVLLLTLALLGFVLRLSGVS